MILWPDAALLWLRGEPVGFLRQASRSGRQLSPYPARRHLRFIPLRAGINSIGLDRHGQRAQPGPCKRRNATAL